MRKAAILALAAFMTCVSGYAQKKRVAVMNFDFATVQSNVNAIFGANQDIGKGIADLLVDRLVTDGTYSVIERKMLDKIIAEQNFSNSDRADANSAAKIGKILGVDAIIIGSITQFGRDDQHTNIGGGGYGLGRFGLGGVGTKSAKAVVGISARMVSTDTAEILSVAAGKGESKRSGTSLLGGGGGWSGGGGGALDMGSSNFANTIIGEAVAQAVTNTAAELNRNSEKLPMHVVTIDGLVADATGGVLTLNVGSRAGVRVGDKLQVRRATREIKDPATGKVIRRVEDSIGIVTITEVDATSAVGAFSGAGAPKVGDHVRNAQ
jgi:curli biogenesis system outer membrane secretion channel CsgG